MKQIILTIILLSAVLSKTEGQAIFSEKLSDAALELTKQHVRYDPDYFTIAYPNGDVPKDKGVYTRLENVPSLLLKEVKSYLKKAMGYQTEN